MPFNGNEWAKGKRFISLREILRVVTSEFGEVEHQRGERSDVAKNYRVPGFAGNFGIIGSMSQPFCSGCNRIRLTADGMIKNCLFSNEKDDLDLRKYLRDSSIKWVYSGGWILGKDFIFKKEMFLFDAYRNEAKSAKRSSGSKEKTSPFF